MKNEYILHKQNWYLSLFEGFFESLKIKKLVIIICYTSIDRESDSKHLLYELRCVKINQKGAKMLT